LSILFGCLTSQPSWAKSLSPAGGIEAPVSLKGHMSILRDPRGTLTIDDIASRRPGLEFKPIPSMLTEGYVKGAVWVRFSLSAPAWPRHWLLQVERPLIQQVTLYAPSADGRLEASRPIGFRPNAGDGDVAYAALFPIAVQPTETDYYIRLQ